ncbi:4-hydroxybenzoate 3-monooxygenase [Gordonia sp. CPCC 206044]|uniref:4-hydroxybenzoate 3-monooxygenase n=1 Tax=Gordonia sp. CPCC 206044 TaxID=3140793 RepID=UPI003AF3DB0D
MTERCQVAIIGAGPAGLALGHMLHLQGIDSVILERQSESHVRSRVRAGVLEQTTVDLLTDIGVAERLRREALVHNGFYLRFDRTTHHLDFHRHSGRHAYVYGQAEVVADLIDARKATGRPLIFDADDVTIADIDTDRPVVEYTDVDGRRRRIEAEAVAGCDGSHGVSRTMMPSDTRILVRSHPFAWLGILAHTRPVTEEGMYSAHPDGLSVHSMRGPRLSRQYLQVPAETDLDAWTDERIWRELRRRSQSDDHPPLETGEIIEKSLAPLRSVVTDRMQTGSLYLLGDAAHIVPPTGAKGLNLAISDACALSYALGRRHRTGDRSALTSYTDTVLPRIWQAQSFSWRLTSVLHRFGEDPYDWELRRARLTRWTQSPSEQQALGEVYLGLPFPTPWRFDG